MDLIYFDINKLQIKQLDNKYEMSYNNQPLKLKLPLSLLYINDNKVYLQIHKDVDVFNNIITDILTKIDNSIPENIQPLFSDNILVTALTDKSLIYDFSTSNKAANRIETDNIYHSRNIMLVQPTISFTELIHINDHTIKIQSSLIICYIFKNYFREYLRSIASTLAEIVDTI